jgi:hypothetical protein
MKQIVRVAVFLTLLAALILPQTALAQGPIGDKFVMGGTYVLQEGEVLSGSLVVFGGSATLEEGSTVQGDVILAGGAVQVSGEVSGSIVVAGGLISLRESAVVQGDITSVGGNIDRDPGAQVNGNITDGTVNPFELFSPGGVFPDVQFRFNPLLDVLWFFLRSFMWAALAVLVVLFLQVQTERTAKAAVSQPLIAGGLGLLTVVVVPLLAVTVSLTIILIPVGLVAFLALVISWAFGVIVVGTEVGKRIADLLKQEWALAASAGIGTFVLTLVTNGLGWLVPCVGWVAPALVGIVGLGAVLLTRYGTRDYPVYETAQPILQAGPEPDPET